jgi:hypothetical protein
VLQTQFIEPIEQLGAGGRGERQAGQERGERARPASVQVLGTPLQAKVVGGSDAF